MAKPRIFISSTYYDLKYVRSSIELFIEALGYDAVLSEKGDIAYSPDVPLDESCYREVVNTDVYVLIVGGRYGSEASDQKKKLEAEDMKSFYQRYESVTKQEYTTAVEQGIPIYVLIEKSVYAEYQTFQRNRENRNIHYAHVESANIFHFIEEILAQPRNNPMQTFDRYADIEDWLRDQWAGLFRELLRHRTGQLQLSSLSGQVAQLSEVNETLKRYLEQVLTQVAPKDASRVIENETARILKAQQQRLLAKNNFISHLLRNNIPLEEIEQSLVEAQTSSDFVDFLKCKSADNKQLSLVLQLLSEQVGSQNVVKNDVNEARALLGRSPLYLTPFIGSAEPKAGGSMQPRLGRRLAPKTDNALKVEEVKD